ncbi:MAG: ribosome-associated translation inhibitor RaiA [Sphingomonadales bacterium]|nr:ribosome-associated translation inhibitor RaiA [Sphingomonadales bacterium]
MKVVINGHQISVGDALRFHVDENLKTVVGKYFTNSIEATVTFSKDGAFHRADCTVHIGKDLFLHARSDDADIYAAFNQAVERLDKRLRRYKNRLKDHHKRRLDSAADAWRVSYSVIPAAEDLPEEANGDMNGGPVTVAESTTQIPRLTVSDAVMQLDLADNPVLVFRNSAHDEINVVYRRKDGNIGWIDPAKRSKEA